MQILINGLLQGMLIGVIGVVFALAYRTARVFHVALGGCIALAPYLAKHAIAAGLPWGTAILLAVVDRHGRRCVDRNLGTLAAGMQACAIRTPPHRLARHLPHLGSDHRPDLGE